LTSTAYPFGSSLTTGYYAGGLVDPSLTWETTQTLDFGLDASLLNGRLNITADWYDKQTFNILRSYQVPLYVGLGAPTVNNGRVKNTGFELDIQYQDKITDDLSYKIGGNIQTYKNTLVEYGAREIGGNTIREEGRPLDEFYLYQWDGIFQSQAEIDNSPAQQLRQNQEI
jgi:outer membrane receptor protein involved in Fe transport